MRRSIKVFLGEEARLVGVDAEMNQLHLRLGPRQCRGTLEGIGVVMLVDQVQYIGAVGL